MPELSRRTLLSIAPLIYWPRKECLVLEAIAAERMPKRMVVRGVKWAAFFELRDYGAAPCCLSWGMQPVGRQGGRLLFAFDSLADREKVWREAGPVPASAELREIAIFKTIS